MRKIKAMLKYLLFGKKNKLRAALDMPTFFYELSKKN